MKTRYFVAVGMLIAGMCPARAAVIFNLASPTLTTCPGGTVEFTGTFQNTGSSDVFLNADSLESLSGNAVFTGATEGSFLRVDDTPLFANVYSLAANGGTYTGPFFDVRVDSATPPGIYSAVYTIQGGANGFALDNLASVTFSVNVQNPSSVPEPGSMLMLATGIAILSGRKWRQVFSGKSR